MQETGGKENNEYWHCSAVGRQLKCTFYWETNKSRKNYIFFQIYPCLLLFIDVFRIICNFVSRISVYRQITMKNKDMSQKTDNYILIHTNFNQYLRYVKTIKK